MAAGSWLKSLQIVPRRRGPVNISLGGGAYFSEGVLPISLGGVEGARMLTVKMIFRRGKRFFVGLLAIGGTAGAQALRCCPAGAQALRCCPAGAQALRCCQWARRGAAVLPVGQAWRCGAAIQPKTAARCGAAALVVRCGWWRGVDGGAR